MDLVTCVRTTLLLLLGQPHRDHQRMEAAILNRAHLNHDRVEECLLLVDARGACTFAPSRMRAIMLTICAGGQERSASVMAGSCIRRRQESA
jgi:hypothetical protein